jgi:D-glycero-alpha-D-manno-heptose 1-phosphate guanylyltransferase
MMEAVILCGGLGTRIRGVLPDRPKCLAPIAGRTYLDLLTDFLHEQGVTRMIFATGHMADQVGDWVRSVDRPWSWALSPETAPMGTGGALRLACEHIESAHFLAFNGDTFLELRCNNFMDFHIKQEADITLAAVGVSDTSAYGRIDTEGGWVSCFLEKGKSGPGLINGGAYAIRTAFFKTLPLDPFSFEKDVLMKGDIGPGAFVTTGQFLDIGTPENLAIAQSVASAFTPHPPKP